MSTRTNVALRLGPWLIGGSGEMILQGVLLVMTTNYFVRYHKDKRALRWFVIILNILCLGKAFQTLWSLWDFFVTHFNTPVNMLYLTKTIPTMLNPLTTALVRVMVQMFFVVRMYRLLVKNWPRWVNSIVVTFTALCVFSGLGGACAMSYFMIKGPRPGATQAQLKAHVTRLGHMVIIMLSTDMAADVIITGCIVFHLVRNKTEYKRTNRLIYRLVAVTWQSALPPTLFAALYLLFYTEQINGKTDSIFTVWSLMLPHLYAISAMYTLNIRDDIREKTAYSSYVVTDPSHSSGQSSSSPRERTTFGGTRVVIQKDMDIKMEKDEKPVFHIINPRRGQTISPLGATFMKKDESIAEESFDSEDRRGSHAL